MATMLNIVLSIKLYVWCCKNHLTPHTGKTEFMRLSCTWLIGSKQALLQGGHQIKEVHATRCLGVEIEVIIEVRQTFK